MRLDPRESGYGRKIDITSADHLDIENSHLMLNVDFLIRKLGIEDNILGLSNGLLNLIPYYKRYISSVSRNSLKASLQDQFNLNKAINYYKPDLIVELGGGLSSVTIANYTINNSAKHLLIDESPKWAQNTFMGLRSCGLPLPTYFELKETRKKVKSNNFVNRNPLLINHDDYLDYSFNQRWIIDSLANSKRTFVYVDGGIPPNLNLLQGASFLVDELVDSMLDNCLVFIDYRRKASQAISYHNNYSLVYSSNTHFTVGGIDCSMPINTLGSSIFSKGCTIDINPTADIL